LSELLKILTIFYYTTNFALENEKNIADFAFCDIMQFHFVRFLFVFQIPNYFSHIIQKSNS